MPILHPDREAAKLIVTGSIIAIAGAYTIRTGALGNYLQRFAWLGRRQYTRDPQPRDRRLYYVIGSLGIILGLAAIGFGVHTLVAR